MNIRTLTILFLYASIWITNIYTMENTNIIKPSTPPPLSQAEKRTSLEAFLKIMFNKIRSGEAHPDSTATDEKLTILHLATLCNKCDVLQEALELGTNVNSANTDGATPLMAAGFHGYANMVELLLNHHADISCLEKTNNINALHSTAQGGNLAALKLILTNLQDHPRKINIINHRSNTGETPLDIAIQQKDDVAVYYLLKYGANPNACSCYTPALVLVAQMPINSKKDKRVCINMTKSLLLFGADINGQDKGGETALFKAARGGNLVLVQTLLQHGANVNHVNHEGHLPVIIAIGNMFKYKQAKQLTQLLIDSTSIEKVQNLFETYLFLWGKLFDLVYDH
ncbi:MAG TPA: ankyrin repeat domain-containing protein [Candidatus Dependentiae bacterium]|nr:ankyrin repeat domain-containing protein [Candidatus Dependentiae bacterium]HRQ62839.1 ankyrin repeat domain-containing protein [Candidatus Dependentiae bacterium]